MIILIGVVVVFFAAKQYSQTAPDASACSSADVLEALPECADQWRVGSNVTVENQCSYDITVHWKVTGGSDYITDLAPGAMKQVATYPLRIEAVSCCPQYNRCF